MCARAPEHTGRAIRDSRAPGQSEGPRLGGGSSHDVVPARNATRPWKRTDGPSLPDSGADRQPGARGVRAGERGAGNSTVQTRPGAPGVQSRPCGSLGPPVGREGHELGADGARNQEPAKARARSPRAHWAGSGAPSPRTLSLRLPTHLPGEEMESQRGHVRAPTNLAGAGRVGGRAWGREVTPASITLRKRKAPLRESP